MGTEGQRYQRQLRNYLLDPKVQLKFTLVIVVLTSLLTAGLGYFWYAEMRKASDVIRVNALSSLGEDAARMVEAELASQDLTRLLILVGFGLVLALLIAGYGIVVTHKVAGPLFKITRHMGDIENNRLYPLWGLRKGDQLQEFFDTFNRMHGALRDRVQEDMRLLNKVIAAIDRQEDLQELKPELKERLEQKGDSLREASESTQRIKRPEG